MAESDDHTSGYTPSFDQPELATQPSTQVGSYTYSDPKYRYTLGEEISRGGMGIIFRAMDEILNREVAIKVLQSRFNPNSSMAQRFADEARISAQLQHPGIPPIHDFGRLPDARPFLAMKLIKGQTLERLLYTREHANQDHARLIAIFEQICQAMGYAHAHKVIHRDLKPSNIMVGAFGEVQVMDWGLAKVLATSVEEVSDPDLTTAETRVISQRESDGSFTQAGSLLGTPAYISPEQALGALHKINERSDVFGLGAILAVILTGKPPYIADSADAVRLMAAQGDLEDCFHRLDQCGWDQELIQLCKRCLNPKPEKRPANAGEVAEAIGQFRQAAEERARQAELDKVRLEAKHRETMTRAADRRRRRNLITAAAGVLVLVVISSLTIGLYAVSRERDATREQKNLAEENFKLAFDASNGSFEVVSIAEPYLASRPDAMEARKQALIAGVQAFRVFLEQKPDDLQLPIRAANICRMAANALRFEGQILKAEPLYLEGIELLRKHPQASRLEVEQAKLLRDYAQALVYKGQLSQALVQADQAKSIFEKHRLPDSNSPELIRSLGLIQLDRAGMLSELGRLTEAETAAVQSVKHLSELIQLPPGQSSHAYDRLFYGSALSRLASIERSTNRLEAALVRHVEAVSQYQLYLDRVQKSEANDPTAKPNKYVQFDPHLFEGVNMADVYHFVTRARFEQAQSRMLDPNHKSIEPLLVAVVSQWENLSKAIPRAIIYRMSLSRAYVVRGNWYSEQGRLMEAKADLELAKNELTGLISFLPDLPSLHYELGRACNAIARLNQDADIQKLAEKHLQKAFELSPESTEIRETIERLQAAPAD